MTNGYKNRDIRRKKKKVAAVDDGKGIQLVVDLTMYSAADTRDIPSKQVADLKMSTSEELATRRRSMRKEVPTVKALEAIVDAHSRANKRNKKDKE